MTAAIAAASWGTNAPSPAPAPWVPDQGDGTYKNPVLFADYSDPDAIRVGSDFYLVSSSFLAAPGLPVLHSKDLVNWTIINHIFAQQPPADFFSKPRHGQGVWAPAIRHHAGRFWVTYPDPDFGVYLTTAVDPVGAWTPPQLILPGKGLIDPCPFWDDDGRLFLVHGWAKSRAGIANRITLREFSPDGTRALDDGNVIIDGDKIPDWNTLEGPKLYKRNGYYYVFAPSGGVVIGYQAVFRATNVHGPYEHRIVLAQGRTTINGPHQGAWIDTPSGEDWFLHFQDCGPFGRVVHLQPMTWRDDWPVMGADSGAQGPGEPLLVHRKPDVGRTWPVAVPQTSDEFDAPSLGLQWQWNANPRAAWFSLTARPGFLRLYSATAPGKRNDGSPAVRNLYDAPNLLLQKFPAPAFDVTTTLEFSPAAAGETAGLMVYGCAYALLGMRRTVTGRRLVLLVNPAANQPGAEEHEDAGVDLAEAPVTLRLTVDAQAIGRFSYSLDQQTFCPIGAPFQAVADRWVGARFGLIATAAPDAAATGHADFDWFRVTPVSRPASTGRSPCSASALPMSRLPPLSLVRCALPLLALLGAPASPAADSALFQAPASPRGEYNFNPDWRFIRADVAGAEQPGFDDSAWTAVSTPHTWNDVDSYRQLIRHSGGDQGTYLGIGWYRKHFRLPASAKGQKVFLEFEGLKQAGRFFLNGKPLGKFENGVTACGLDLTDGVGFGDADNLLAVQVDNRDDYREEATGIRYQWMSKDFNPNFGGLNHDVRLHLMGRIYQTLPLYENLQTTGVYVYAKDPDIAAHTTGVGVEAQVRNESGDFASITLSVVVVDAAGAIRAQFDGEPSDLVNGQTETLTASGMLADAHFWDVNDPYLYTVYSILTVDGKVVDVCPTRTGFRKTAFRGGAGTGGVYLNDHFVWLTGFAQRSVNDWAGLGQAYPDWMHEANAALLRSSHSNYIRWMHIAPQAVDVRACDRFGLVEICPAGDKERDVPGRQWEQRAEVMRDTIIAYRNHPSILFWEAGNQVISPAHMTEMVALRQQWDPHGGRAMGVRHGDDNAAATAVTPIAEYYGVMIGQDHRTDELPSPTAVFRGYSAERRDRAPLIETEDLRDEALRSIWDNESPPHFGFHQGPEDTYNWNSESFCLQAARRYHAYIINRIDNPDPAHSKWSGYASIYWSDSDADGRQQSSAVLRVSGKVDAMRLPKEAFYVYRVMQNPQPDLHLIGHWTYPAHTNKTVVVAANHCDAVELFVNGHSLGKVTQPEDGYIYSFPNVAFEPGSIKAVGTRDGRVVAQEQLETAGAPHALRLTPHTGPAGLQANGSDVALIDFEVVDAQGRRCPTDEARVDFAVTGPIIWRGGLNSAVVNSTNNLYLNTECGINRVAIRSTLTPGTITVTATRDGLAPATVTLQSLPVNIIHGLEPLPSPDLPAPAPL